RFVAGQEAMMPWQLRNAQRPKRSEPRGMVELTPCIDIHDLVRQRVFPDTNYERWTLQMDFKYPFLKSLVISRQTIEFNHILRYTQRVGLHWIRTHFGRSRPIFICECGYGVRRLYFRHGHLACKHCHRLIHASQACSREKRPCLQAQRMHMFLKLKTGMWKSTRQRLKARITTAVSQDLKSRRLAHHSIQIPSSNYCTRGAMHWR